MPEISGLGTAAVQRVTNAAASDPQGQKKGTLTTPQGPINWAQSSDGTIQAEGGGQTVTVSGQFQSDGSWHTHAVYAQTGKAAYLTMDSSGEEAQHQVALTFSAGSSQLTLTVTGINALVTSGSATLSGTWNGAAIHWTGSADLSSNAFATRPIAGWPAGAFGSQLKEAAFFAPLGKALGQSILAQPGTTAHVVSASGVRRGAVGVLTRAGSWCLGGAAAGAVAGPETFGASMLLGCVGGGGASLLSDLFSAMDDDGPQSDPPPVLNPPYEESVTTRVQGTAQDSNFGDDPGDQGSGGDGDGGGDGGSRNPIDDPETQTTHLQD